MSKSLPQIGIALEFIGWTGTLMILAAFVLNSFGVIESQSYMYQLLNLVGAIGIMAISLYKKVYQTVALNVVWACIALIAIINIVRGGIGG